MAAKPKKSIKKDGVELMPDERVPVDHAIEISISPVIQDELNAKADAEAEITRQVAAFTVRDHTSCATCGGSAVVRRTGGVVTQDLVVTTPCPGPTKPCHCCGNPVKPGEFCPVDGNITL